MTYVQKGFLTSEILPVDTQDLQGMTSSHLLHTQTPTNNAAKERGAIFTRHEVVAFMLDLIGYLPEEDLSQTSLLEPSFGSGDFFLVALERLLLSYFLHDGKISNIVSSLKNCLQGIELYQESFALTYSKVLQVLEHYGVSKQDAHELADIWLKCGDFLLTSLPATFTYIVGNPPYLRQELIPDQLLASYRLRYKTIYDRADLYVPFMEHSLMLLAPEGKLSLICPDRWIKNRYGRPLRELISYRFHLQAYINMVDTDAFQSEVTAYPAITLLTTQKSSKTYVVHKPTIEPLFLKSLATSLRKCLLTDDQRIQVLVNVVDSGHPWLIGAVDQLTLLRRLEDMFPLLEDSGCKVSIGVATGCDSIYIGHTNDLPIEEVRKLPLAMASDIQMGRISWSEHYVVNPFDEAGKLIDLAHFPLLAQYFRLHEAKIRNRNVAKRAPAAWYRTIDKIYMPLAQQPKLFIPDIKGKPAVVYDEGKYYPHHNLYYVISTQWDLRALQAVLQSPIAKLFVSAYSIKMRGGYMRFQAQNLRRIRLPRWEMVSLSLRERLIASVQAQDTHMRDEAVFDVYQLNQGERSLLQQ